MLNGLAGHARKWVGVVQEKTGRKDLRLTTCLPLQGAISPQGLLVSWQRWCPICYQVWSNDGHILYEPLLWSLRAVEVCSEHHVRLVGHCPQCGRTFAPARARAQSGLCSWCQGWLGSYDGNQMVPPSQHQTSVEALIACVSGGRRLSRLRLRDNIQIIISRCGLSQLAANTGLTRNLFRKHDNERWTLPVVSQLAIALGLSLGSLLFDDLAEHPVDVRVPNVKSHPQPVVNSQPLVVGLHRGTRRSIEIRINQYVESFDFERRLRVKDVAGHVGCTASYLYERFPGLGEELRTRYHESVRQRMTAVWQESALPLSLAEVARRCRVDIHSAQYIVPHLCDDIKERYARYRQTRHEDQVTRVRQEFASLLRETVSNPPT